MWEVGKMNLETVQNSLDTCLLVCNKREKITVEGELIVNDIKPDILNLLNLSANCFITNQEVMENRVKVEGVVDVYIIYLADDESNSIRGLNQSIEFTEYFDAMGVTSQSLLKTSCEINSLDAKVVNSRKIGIKSLVTINMEAYENKVCSITTDLLDARNVEVKKEELQYKTIANMKYDEVTLNETVELGDEQKPIGEILKASIQIVNPDYKTSYNKILAKAEAYIKIIYLADDDTFSVQSFETKLPVMGFIDVDNFSEDMEVQLDYFIKSFHVKPVYQDLKANSITVSSEIEICAMLYHMVHLDVISDLYSTEQKINFQYEELNVLENVFQDQATFELSQSLLIPELDSIHILGVEAIPSLLNTEVLEGKLALEGNIDFVILFYRNDKKMLDSKKMELPFQQVIKMPNLHNSMHPRVKLNINEITNKIVGQNQLQIDLKMDVMAVQSMNHSIRSIQNIEVCEEELTLLPSLTIYYVREGDSLWEIAKRYHTTVEILKRINELKDDMIYPGQQLIIPKFRKEPEAISLV